MKLKMTVEATKQLKVLNNKLEESDYEYFDKMKTSERLLIDAGLYVEDGYEKNKFNDLKKWCNMVGELEYNSKYLKKHPNVVFNKVNKMIQKGILVVAK